MTPSPSSAACDDLVYHHVLRRLCPLRTQSASKVQALHGEEGPSPKALPLRNCLQGAWAYLEATCVLAQEGADRLQALHAPSEAREGGRSGARHGRGIALASLGALLPLAIRW